MVETAVQAIPDADVVLWLVDVSVPPSKEDHRIAALLQEKAAGRPVVLGLNKADAAGETKTATNGEQYAALVTAADLLPLSALRGMNTAELLKLVIDRLPLGPRYYPSDQVTDQQERFIVAELVREQVLRYAQEEVPHAVAVVVEDFKRRSQDMTYISASIFVERDTQKKILLGAGGQLIKRIGSAARREIEPVVGSRVYLDLWIKVRPKWRKKVHELRRLGYALTD
jgi:GTP-binding protein Era